MPQVKYVSNEIEDFEQGGGLYPGGTGIIEELKFVLWDYDGKQPKDSALAVYMKFQPTDGSNEGKPVEQYWSAGDAASFSPDPTGGFLVPLKTRSAQSDNSNWALVLKRLRDNCGLEPGKLSGEEKGKEGIRALERSEATFSRIDQPTREGMPEKDQAAKKFKATILVPTKAKFPWEKGAGRTATKTTAPATSAAASTPTNGSTPAASGTNDLSILIKEIAEAAGGVINFADIPKELTGKLANVDRTQRVAMVKQAKDAAYIEALAKENEWTFDGKELIL